MTPMSRRLRAAQACIDRFAGKAYAPGKRDCLRLVRHALHSARRRVGQGRWPEYSTEAGGLRAMRRRGYSSLVEAMDATGLERIPPAAALPGDIIALPSEEGCPFGCALTVAVGNGRVIGFFQGVAEVGEPKAYVAAWRVF